MDLHAAMPVGKQAQHKMDGGLALDVLVSQGAAVLQLLADKDQALLLGRDALLVLKLALYGPRAAPPA